MALLTADTMYGRVRGVPSSRNPQHTVFRGIPFAAPPTGDLRFAAPQPPKAWEGERYCDSFSAACVQKLHPNDTFIREVSEDCLYLNVYTPAERAEDKLPVLVWIYGGGFANGFSGDPEFDGDAMNAKGAVVVTINYRCGVFGFFTLPELVEKNGYAGNVGLLDQIAALQWVRDNIAAFGGDPERVLLFGQSAGGMSTRMLLTSPAAKGLFSRAVIESGGGLNEADLVRPREEFTRLCQNAMSHAGLSFRDLMEGDAAEIYDKMTRSARETATSPELNYFQPFVDGFVLDEVPGVKILRGEYMDIPIINMTVAGDAAMFSRKVHEELDELLCTRLGIPVPPRAQKPGPEGPDRGPAKPVLTGPERNAAKPVPQGPERGLAGPAPKGPDRGPAEPVPQGPGRDAAESGPGRETGGSSDPALEEARSRCLRGFAMVSSQAWAQHQVSTGRTPIYTAYMDRTQPKETIRRPSPYGTMTPHSAEIPYVFGTLYVRSSSYAEEDRAISDMLTAYWVNFASGGDPNGEGLPAWTPYTKERPLTLHVGDDGICLENVVKSREEQRIADYTKAHPGMLCSLEGF